MKKRKLAVLGLALLLLLSACVGKEKPVGTDPLTDAVPTESVFDTTEPITTPKETETAPVTTKPEETVTTPTETEPTTTKPEETETTPASTDPIRGEIPADPAAKIALSLDWVAEPLSTDRYKITVILYLNSYSVFVGERDDGELSIGTNRKSFHSDKIDYEDDKKVKTALTEYTFEHTVSGTDARSLPVSASWYFGGVYAETPVDRLSLDGMIRLDQPAS